MFKVTKLFALLGVAALGLGFDADPAHAQREYIERGHLKLENTSNGARKFCIRPTEDWRIFLRKCYTLEAGEWVIFERREPNRGFKLALYEVRRGPDRVIRDGQLSRDTVYVRTSGNNGWAQPSYRPRPGPPPPEYRVRFCNQTQAEDVWVIVGYTGANQTFTEGYWSVSRGDCTTVNFTQLMLTAGIGRPDQPPRTFYRAFTYGENRKTWGGSREREDPVLCVNTSRKFRENQIIRRDDGEYEFNPCDGEDEAELRFRWGPVFDQEVQTALINF